MKKLLGSLAAAACLIATSGAAHAYLTATLTQALDDTVTIRTGDKAFSDFDFAATGQFGVGGSNPITSDDVIIEYGLTGPGGPVVDLAGDYGIVFTFPGTLTSGTGDIALSYTVTATDPGAKISDVELDANAAAVGTGVVSVTEAFTGTSLAPLEVFATGTSDVLSDSENIIPPVKSLNVTKDIAVTAGDTLATVSIIGQYFSETTTVPEPGMVAMLVGMGSGGLLVLRRRRK
jgi:hypothetical protein